LTALARLENKNVMFSTATPLPGKALAWLSEDRALLDIGPVSLHPSRVVTKPTQRDLKVEFFDRPA
jgi:hypothetical protein